MSVFRSEAQRSRLLSSRGGQLHMLAMDHFFLILRHWRGNYLDCKTLHPAWALEVFESWGSKHWPGPWRARGARAYNGGLGQSPQQSPGTEPQVGGFRGALPLNLQWKLQIRPFF